ncbi:MAG: cytidine deaminase [Treponema sp.]|nr:cytidine deaminase [Treponema sp.]
MLVESRMENVTDELLVKKALEARANSYSPYSKYRVGAALLCDDGTVYTGCNVENASYPCGICAERNAMSSAVSGGHRSFSKIAIAGSSDVICTPCGMCRQFMYEFNPGLTVLCAANDGRFETHSLKELLVGGFGPESL